MSVTIRQMLEAGVHFGHQTRFWNPRMAPYIFGHRNKIHIINLEKTLVKYQEATRYLRQLAATRELAKLTSSLGGIKDLNGLPDALFIVDVGYHKIAVTEARKLGVPIVGVVDTNHSPEGIDYVIPGNDDSGRAVRLYARGVADAILEGKAARLQETVKAATEEDEFVEVGTEEEA